MTNWYTSAGWVGGDPAEHSDHIEYALPVKTLNVWWDSNCILAFQFIYPNGIQYTAGSPRSNLTTMKFAAGEVITSLIMMETDGDGTAGHHMLGQIRIQTDKGQNVNFGPGGSWTYNLPVGSGILCGYQTSYGLNSGISRLNLSLLCPIKSIVSAVVIDELWKAPIGTRDGISQVTLGSDMVKNENADPANWEFNGAIKVTNTTSFSQTSSESFGISIKVTAGIPALASVESTFEWQKTDSTTHATTTSNEVSFGNTVSGILKANESVYAATICEQGILDIPYNSTVTITFQDSSIPPKTYSESGIFKHSLSINGRTVVKASP